MTNSADPQEKASPRAGCRDIRASDLVRVMQHALGLPETVHPPARFMPAGMPADAVIRDVDVQSLILWTMEGLSLFSAHCPTARELRKASVRVGLVAGMRRHGGILSRVAGDLKLSRSALRKALRELGLYPWPARIL